MSKAELEISGMHCGSCVKLLTASLKEVADLSDIVVTLEPPTAVFEWSPKQAVAEQIVAVVEECGFQVVSGLEVKKN